MKKRITSLLVVLMLLTCIESGYAAVPKLTDMTKQYQLGELEYHQRTLDVPLVPFSVFKIVPSASGNKFQVDEASLEGFNKNLLSYKGIRTYSISYLNGRSDYKRFTFEEVLKGIKLEDLEKIKNVPTATKFHDYDAVITLIDENLQIIGYSLCHISETGLTEITESMIPDKPTLANIPLFDEALITVKKGDIPESWKSWVKYAHDIDFNKVKEKYPELEGVRIMSGNPKSNDEVKINLNDLKRIDNSVKKLHESGVYGTVTDTELNVYIVGLYNSQKELFAYNLIRTEGEKWRVLGTEPLYPNLRVSTPQFGTQALSLSENVKSKKISMKIDRSKLSNTMKQFTKYTLNATNKNEFYGIDKSFTAEGIVKSKKYKYNDLVGFEVAPDSQRIFCLQLYNDKNELLGYVMFK